MMLSKHVSGKLLHWHRRWLTITAGHQSQVAPTPAHHTDVVPQTAGVLDMFPNVQVLGLVRQEDIQLVTDRNSGQNCVMKNITFSTQISPELPSLYPGKQYVRQHILTRTTVSSFQTTGQYSQNCRNFHTSSSDLKSCNETDEDTESNHTVHKKLNGIIFRNAKNHPAQTSIPMSNDAHISPGQKLPDEEAEANSSGTFPRHVSMTDQGVRDNLNVVQIPFSRPRAEKSIKQEILAFKYEVDYVKLTRMSQELDTTTADTGGELIPDAAKLDPELITYEDEEGNIVKVEEVEKRVIEPIYTFAPLVNKSELLQKLVRLGVDLSLIEKKGLANYIIKMDFERDVVPYLHFLTDAGVPHDELSQVLSKCPYLFKEDLKDLNVRVNYLRSKNFRKSQIGTLITKSPQFLLMSVTGIDAKLGFLQQEFWLSGTELRNTVCKATKLITSNKEDIRKNRDRLKLMLCFTGPEMKQMFLDAPKVYLKDSNRLIGTFEYVHRVMGLTHEMILTYPSVLCSRVRHLEPRHRFLLKVGRAQYNLHRPNYVSLQALIAGDDAEWCIQVAKATLVEYHQFQKMI